MRTTLFATAAALAFAAAASAQEVTLRVHHFLSTDSTTHKALLVPWEVAVEAQSGGRIDVQIYPAMQLGGKPPQLYDQARDGIVDITWTLLGYTPGRFPRSEVFELPFLAGTAMASTMALQGYQEKYLGEELEDVHPLLLHSGSAYKIHTRDKAVATMADLQGQKIRAPSRTMTDVLDALGATAVGMPVPEVPQALATGVIDGAVLPWEVIGSLRTETMTPNHTEFGHENGGMSTSVFALVMNKATYDALPDDLKAVIDDNSGAYLAPLAGAAFDAAEAEERQKAIDAGDTFTTVPDAEIAAWAAASQPVVDAWAASMDADGLDGAAMLEDARAMMAAGGS